ncbi:MAG: DNA topoisomerase I, partial [Candidatus Bathyarchaeia archaeon]
SGREKYIWLADTFTVKQQRDREKFDKAKDLEKTIEKVRSHIESSLNDTDIKRRKIATVCYLIDLLKLRVGDEKDEDEADTVGATTLRPEHIKISESDTVTFDFLGKDSVRWKTKVRLPEAVVRNLKEFIDESNSSIFEGVRSEAVGQFLGEVSPGLTAKVFRTYHATKAVKEYLAKNNLAKTAPEYQKKHVAALANLQAAIVCHHKRTLPKKWKETLERKRERLRKLKEKKTKKSLQMIEKAKLELERMKLTRDYNLGTSLKSYIDPRVYRDWGRKVDYDWKLYYPNTLQRKFSWIDRQKS